MGEHVALKKKTSNNNNTRQATRQVASSVRLRRSQDHQGPESFQGPQGLASFQGLQGLASSQWLPRVNKVPRPAQVPKDHHAPTTENRRGQGHGHLYRGARGRHGGRWLAIEARTRRRLQGRCHAGGGPLGGGQWRQNR